MNRHIRKADGFVGQEYLVIPEPVIQKIASFPSVTSTCICSAGYYPSARHHYLTRPGGCNDHILIYCTAGCGTYQVAGCRGVLEPNRALMIPAGLPHMYETGDDPWTIYWFHCRGQQAKQYLQCLPADCYEAPIAVKLKQRLIGLFNDLYVTLNAGFSPDNLIFASHTIGFILSNVFFNNEAFTAGIAPGQFRVLEDSIQFMQQNLDASVTLAEFADRANLSVPHYSRIFKQKTGYSPVEYYIRLKIQHACQLLATTDKSIKDVAYSLGYDDPYYFTRIFKRIMTVPPSKYRG